MKNQVFTPKMILSSIGIIVISVILSYVDSLMPNILQVEGYVTHQAWVGAAITAAGGILSSILANKQAQRQTDKINAAQENLEDWRNGIVGTSILDRADSMSMLKAYRDTLEEQNRKFNTGAIKGGITDEAKVAQATAVNKGFADAVSRIAGYGQQQKDRAEQLYQNQLYNYNVQQAEQAGAGAQATGDAIKGAAGVLGEMISGIDWGKKKANE